MRPYRPSQLSRAAQVALLQILRDQGASKSQAAKAVNRLGWVSDRLMEEIVDDRGPLDVFAAGTLPDQAQPDREFLTDIDRIIRSLRWREEEGVDWLNAKHSYSWYSENLTPLLEDLRADIVLSIHQWTDQEARTAAYLKERAKDRQKTKPRKIMAMAEGVAVVWIDLGFEPRRSPAFKAFLSLATEPVRDAAGLGAITDRQIDRLVPRLRKKHEMPGVPGRPKKTPPK